MSMNSFNGGVAGFVGAIPTGIMMTFMGSMQRVANLAGSESLPFGWFLHLTIGSIIGVSYAALAPRLGVRGRGHLAAGFAYGSVWWLLGPLTLMPLMMELPLGWNLAAATAALPSLIGHMIYGMTLGWAYDRLQVIVRKIELVRT